MAKPKIGIGFFGIPRSGKLAFNSIEDNILGPARKLGDVQIRYHLFKQSYIFNRHSGEDGILPLSDYEPFMGLEGVMDDPSIVTDFFDTRPIYAHADAWSDGFVSTLNLLRQLYSLRSVCNQLLSLSPDLVVFARPDLIYHESFEGDLIKALEKCHCSVARLPIWEWSHGGYNDRFSICSGIAIRAYGLRAERVYDYLLATKKPLQSELFLKYALDSALCPVHPFGLKASRIRLEGRLENERFKAVGGARLIKFSLREFAKNLIRNL